MQRHLQDTGHVFWRPSLKEKRDAARRSEGLNPPSISKKYLGSGQCCASQDAEGPETTWAPQIPWLPQIVEFGIGYWMGPQYLEFNAAPRIYYRDVHMPELLVFRPMGQSHTEDVAWMAILDGFVHFLFTASSPHSLVSLAGVIFRRF